MVLKNLSKMLKKVLGKEFTGTTGKDLLTYLEENGQSLNQKYDSWDEHRSFANNDPFQYFLDMTKEAAKEFLKVITVVDDSYVDEEGNTFMCLADVESPTVGIRYDSREGQIQDLYDLIELAKKVSKEVPGKITITADSAEWNKYAIEVVVSKGRILKNKQEYILEDDGKDELLLSLVWLAYKCYNHDINEVAKNKVTWIKPCTSWKACVKEAFKEKYNIDFRGNTGNQLYRCVGDFQKKHEPDFLLDGQGVEFSIQTKKTVVESLRDDLDFWNFFDIPTDTEYDSFEEIPESVTEVHTYWQNDYLNKKENRSITNVIDLLSQKQYESHEMISLEITSTVGEIDIDFDDNEYMVEGNLVIDLNHLYVLCEFYDIALMYLDQDLDSLQFSQLKFSWKKTL